MINLLIGPPGGGKSYEAVVYHILPALNAGRKVITNLPLELDRLILLGFDTSLIEIVTKTKAVEPEKNWEKAESMYQKFGIAAKAEYFVNRPFAHPEDYGNAWRHPENGSGPLYVIDECHLALPSRGTKIAVEEWFSLHRHESADVLLITQSYGKCSKAIIDLVQVCYRVKKGTAFGAANNYIRKVQDGVRGDVVNEAIRKYEKRYFGLYKSHTRGGGSELAANDIVPLWKRWPFIGAALFLSLGVGIFVFSSASINPLKNGMSKTATASTSPASPVKVDQFVNGQPVTQTPSPQTNMVPAQNNQVDHPYAGRGLHVVGTLINGLKTRVLFIVSQNGQQVSDVDNFDLVKLGYTVEATTPCAVKLGYGAWKQWVICDAPQVAIVPESKPGKPAPEEKPNFAIPTNQIQPTIPQQT